MINYISYKVVKVTTKKLEAFYNPLVINKFCEECNKYSKVWSCPPLSFNDIDYINNYKYCYIISGKVFINKIPNPILSTMVTQSLNKYSDISKSKDEFSNIFNGLYYTFREYNDKKILQLEDFYPYSISLASGRCLICNTCTRVDKLPCRYPEKLRYSLEGLGFDISGIIENIVGEKIQWSSNSKPEYVTCVSALLTNDELNENNILLNLR